MTPPMTDTIDVAALVERAKRLMLDNGCPPIFGEFATALHSQADALAANETELDLLRKRVDGLLTAEASLATMREALEHIVQWSEAYPIAAFPEPDFAKVRELLAAGGIEVGAVSASNMRHVVTEVGAIARRALGGSNAE